MTPPEEPRDPKRGYGPVMTADDGTKYQVTEDDVWNAMPLVSAALIVMAALDFSRQQEWVLGDRHYWFSHSFRMLVRTTGFAIAALICLAAAREVKRRERDAEASAEEERELAGRTFVAGKRPGGEP